MSNVASLQKKEWQDEWPFTIQQLSINKLFADERYQRPVLEPFVVNTIVAKFDSALVGTIDVSERGNGTYAILDGRQRVEGMTRVGKKSCWCTVYSGMTIAHESEFFMKKNREKRNIHPFYTLRARKVAGDVVAAAIFNIAKKHKLEAGIGRDKIQAVSALEDTYKMTSPFRESGECLDMTLQTISSAWPGRKGAFDGKIIKALGRIWQSYTGDEVDWDVLVSRLDETSPLQIIGLAEDRRHTSRHPMSYLVANEIVKWYNAKLPRGRRLSLILLKGTRK